MLLGKALGEAGLPCSAGTGLLYRVGESCFGAFEFGFHGGAELGDAVCVGDFADEVFEFFGVVF